MSSVFFLSSETDEGELEMRCARFGPVLGMERVGEEISVTFKYPRGAADCFEKLSKNLKVRIEERQTPHPLNKNPVGLDPLTVSWTRPTAPVSNWSPGQSLREQLKDFARLQIPDLHNRYLVILGVGGSADNLLRELQKFPGADEITDIEVFDAGVAHVTLKSTRAASNLKMALGGKIAENDRLLVSYGSPRSPTRKVWFACAAFPVTEMKKFRVLVESFGALRDFAFLPDRGCSFAVFEREKDAIIARNFLYGLECAPGIRLNVDFVIDDRRWVEDRRIRNDNRTRARSYSRSRSRSRSIPRVINRPNELIKSEETIGRPRDARQCVPEQSIRFELLKMGETVAAVRGRVISGNESIAMNFFQNRIKVNVDQRTKTDHCRTSLGRRDSCILEISSAGGSGSDLIDAFCSYFVEKDRIGFYSEEKEAIYFVPPVMGQSLGISSDSPKSGLLYAVVLGPERRD